MNKALALVLFMILSLSQMPARSYAGGDTGTYRILNYKVMLAPQTDGNVRIDYYQKWEVTGGHIPWITVGVPNDSFVITDHGMAAASASSDCGSGESFVRIDLDKDYQPGETFEVSFSIDQRRLFDEQGSDYVLSFTPGWYDRATIDSLEIAVAAFAEQPEMTADPEPCTKTVSQLTWTRTGLSEGERFTITISCPKSALGNSIPDDNLQGPLKGGSDAGSVTALLVIGLFIFLIVKFSRWRHSYSGGRIYSGGSSHYKGGCACACVSCACACACACAGGGGAGCSRKAEHSCERCSARNTARS